MKKKKMNKKKKRIFKNIALCCMAIVGIIWMGMTYVKLEGINQKYKVELEELEEKSNERRKELNKKRAEVNYYQSDESIERIARQEAGLVMPQEVVFIETE